MFRDITVLITALATLLIVLREFYVKGTFQRRELKFREREYEEKREERQRHEDWLRRETVKLVKVGETLGEHIVAQLRKDTAWASEALQAAKLGPYAETLFGERSSHFHDEKEFIADKFLPLLISRCKHHIEQNGNRVYLLIDSGTTLFPFFRRLALEAKHRHKEPWLRELTIITNNLPGVESMMEFGRIDPHDRYSSLAVKCELLPGVPLPVYSAVAGEKTVAAVGSLKNCLPSNNPKMVFITLLTGNWIRLRRSDPPCPVPLARGAEHLGVKQALLDCASEIYVVSPLGKIFVNASEEQVNTALGFNGNSPDTERYKGVDISAERASSVKLVSTSRKPGRVLSALSNRVCGRLDVREEGFAQFGEAPFNEVTSLCFQFDKLPQNWELQKEQEFPHVYTREDHILKTWFYVDADPVVRRASV